MQEEKRMLMVYKLYCLKKCDRSVLFLRFMNRDRSNGAVRLCAIPVL